MTFLAIDIESSSCCFIKLWGGITKCRKNVIRAGVHKSGRKTFIEGVDYANCSSVATVPKLSHIPQLGSFLQPQSATLRVDSVDSLRRSRPCTPLCDGDMAVATDAADFSEYCLTCAICQGTSWPLGISWLVLM
jgi:hypothetical protein